MLVAVAVDITLQAQHKQVLGPQAVAMVVQVM